MAKIIARDPEQHGLLASLLLPVTAQRWRLRDAALHIQDLAAAGDDELMVGGAGCRSRVVSGIVISLPALRDGRAEHSLCNAHHLRELRPR